MRQDNLGRILNRTIVEVRTSHMLYRNHRFHQPSLVLDNGAVLTFKIDVPECETFHFYEIGPLYIAPNPPVSFRPHGTVLGRLLRDVALDASIEVLNINDSNDPQSKRWRRHAKRLSAAADRLGASSEPFEHIVERVAIAIAATEIGLPTNGSALPAEVWKGFVGVARAALLAVGFADSTS